MNRASIDRRLAAIEARQSGHSRQMHVIIAGDMADRDRQIADLVTAGQVGARDGFLCVLGRPIDVHH